MLLLFILPLLLLPAMAESRNTVSNDGTQRNMNWPWHILKPISTSQHIFEMNTKMEKRGTSGLENLD